MNEKTRHLYGFGPFRLDPEECLLILDGAPVPLPPKAFEALLFLVENAGHLVDKDELMRRLWPDTFVEDGNVAKHVSLLRKVLSEATNGRDYIETIPKRGYRFVVEVRDLAHPGAGSQPSTVHDASLIGKKISHYRVLQVLGGGGMGVVYKAEDLKLGRAVALKFLPEELADSPAALGRFEREARAASALNHPNICTIYAVEEHEAQPFIAMELLEGRTLRDFIEEQQASAENKARQKHIQLKSFLDIVIQIAKGLEAAHGKGIIHRDIKPANVFITNHGQVKILDFGLAKLQESEGWDQAMPPQSEPAPSREGTIPVSFTLTGTTVGTAGYMAPEQVRGDKVVDGRTDLFSLGVVMYEMVTGQRAFPGESIPVLRNAILHDTPVAIRELNREISPRLESVVNRALEKDPELRFQSAAEMREQLELEADAANQERRPSGRGLWRVAAAAMVAVLVAATYWALTRHQVTNSTTPELKIRQLTINSSENQVSTGAISPDGEYLVYTDVKGMHILSIETGETQSVPRPEAKPNKGLIMEAAFFPWFPDGKNLLVDVHAPGNDWTSQGSSMWIIPVSGGSPRKLREDAVGDQIAPDGSLILFTTNKGRFNDRELWLMAPNGEHARKIAEVGENSWFSDLVWSPDGRQILYERIDGPTNGNVHSTNAYTILPITKEAESTAVPTSMTQDWLNALWLPDGRLIVSVREPRTVGVACNFWSLWLDRYSGKPISPRRITDEAQSCVNDPTVSKDGKRLAYQQISSHASLYMVDLEPGRSRGANVSHFTLTESSDYVQDWSADGKAVFFVSRRGGSSRLYKQPLNSDTPEELMSVADEIHDARVSPDGKWIVGLVSPPKGMTGNNVNEQLVRVSTSGGTPQVILQGYPIDQVLCSKQPASLCAVTEQSQDHRHVVISSLDLEKGRGSELIRFEVDPGEQNAYGDLSPDGTRFAFTSRGDPVVRIISLRGRPEVRIPMGNLDLVRSVNWTADGKGLYVSSTKNRGTELWSLDLKGKAALLWSNETGEAPSSTGLESNVARPSPDGRHIAVQAWITNSNMWMMENF